VLDYSVDQNGSIEVNSAMRNLSLISFALGLVLFPSVVTSDIRDIDSSDIMAEIEFLERRLTDGPQVEQITNTKENAILNYLSSYAICEGWDYGEYDAFVSVYERELQPFSGRELRISLLQTSYEARYENGCAINEEAKAVLRVFLVMLRATIQV